MLAEALPLLTGDQGGCPPLCYVTHRAASPGRCRPSAPAPSLHHMLHLASMRTYRVCTCPTCVCVCASMSLSKVLSLGLGLGSGLGSGLGLGFYLSRFAAFSLRSMVVVTTVTV